MQHNPLELYHMMYARELCRGCADMYLAWAYYHEAGGDFRKAEEVYQLGKSERAQPYDDLLKAHTTFYLNIGQSVSQIFLHKIRFNN